MKQLRLQSQDWQSHDWQPQDWDQAIALNRAIPDALLAEAPARPATLPRSRARRRLNIVLVAHYGRTGYNILRSLRAVNARVFLVLDDRAASLRSTRFGRVIHTTRDFAAARPERVAAAINDLHARIGVDRVIGSDVESLTLLDGMKEFLRAPVFPMADAATLARLNDKWHFHELCRSAGVADPKTLLFARKADIDADAIAETLGFPAIVKPVDSYGQRGIVVLRDKAAVNAFVHSGNGAFEGRAIVQEFIEGEDWALSVFARDGVIEHWVAWLCPGQLDASYGVGRFLATEFRPRQDLFEMGRKLVAATNFTGVANLDARFDNRAGEMKMFECNPRFFNRMSAARLCGLDFVAPGLPIAEAQPFAIGARGYYPWQELFSMRGLKRMFRGEWRLPPLLRDLYELSTDPLPPLMRKVRREDKQV